MATAVFYSRGARVTKRERRSWRAQMAAEEEAGAGYNKTAQIIRD
jgi:hypothetical protein